MSQDFCGVFLSKETEPHFLSFALLLHFTTILGKHVTDHCSIVSCSTVSFSPPFPTLFRGADDARLAEAGLQLIQSRRVDCFLS